MASLLKAHPEDNHPANQHHTEETASILSKYHHNWDRFLQQCKKITVPSSFFCWCLFMFPLLEHTKLLTQSPRPTAVQNTSMTRMNRPCMLTVPAGPVLIPKLLFQLTAIRLKDHKLSSSRYDQVSLWDKGRTTEKDRIITIQEFIRKTEHRLRVNTPSASSCHNPFTRFVTIAVNKYHNIITVVYLPHKDSTLAQNSRKHCHVKIKVSHSQPSSIY